MLSVILMVAALDAKIDGDFVSVTVTNEGAVPQLVLSGEDKVLAARVGKELVSTHTLEIEDLGPIARAPAPPRWAKETGETWLCAYVVPAKTTAVVRFPKSVRTVKIVTNATPWLLSEHRAGQVERAKEPTRQFGKWVPQLTAVARYTQRKPAGPMVERPAWDFKDFGVADAPALADAFPALVREKDLAKAVTKNIQSSD